MRNIQDKQTNESTPYITITIKDGPSCHGSFEYIYQCAMECIFIGNRHFGINIINALAEKCTHNPVQLSILSRSLLTASDYQSAMRYAERIVEIKPDASSSWVTLGAAAFALRKPKEAMAALNKAISVYSTDYDSMLDMATLAIDLNHRLAEAEQMIIKAIQLKPQEQEGWIALGGIFDRQNRFIESKYAFKRAITINPDSPQGNMATELCTRLEQRHYSKN